MLAATISVSGCSSKTPGAEDDGGTPVTEGGLLPPSEAGIVGDGGTTPATACAEETRLIHVVTEERGFYRFNAATATLDLIGFLQCEKSGAMPTSMAIDRNGVAWVLYSDETMWNVDIRDASCKPTNYVSGQASFAKFGMGFSTNSNGGTTESLYLSDHFGKGLASLDPRNLVLKFIGPYTGDLRGVTSELTGSGDGKLYGFFVTSPAQVAEISKGTGEILNPKELPGVYAGSAWAFAFYGAKLFIFTNASGTLPRAEGGSDITSYDPKTGVATKVKERIGVKVVGAGVSTCAPYAAPK